MSPVRARSPSSSRSPVRRKMSRSPVRASRKWSRQSISPVQASSPARSKSPIWRRSPQRQKSSVRSRSPIQSRATTRTRSPGRTKAPIRTRSPVRSKSPVRGMSPKRRSSLSRSPSPHTKRLKRSQETMEFDRARDREYDRSSIKDYERGRHKDKDKDSSRDVTQKGRRHSRSISPKDNRQRRRHESESPYRKSAHHIPERPKSSKAGARDEVPNQSPREMSGLCEPISTSITEKLRNEDMSSDALAKMKATEEDLKAKQNEKSKSSFELSGKLAAETNKVRGITLLFNEPPDARRPSLRWRLYVFKGGEALNEPLYIHRQTCYLFGRERRVADIPTDHPSCSKQHAVIQFRQVEKEEPDGTVSKQVRPYLMDLGSTNGTFLNDSRLEPQRYYELFEKDTIKFGNSSREYVILHENSAG